MDKSAKNTTRLDQENYINIEKAWRAFLNVIINSQKIPALPKAQIRVARIKSLGNNYYRITFPMKEYELHCYDPARQHILESESRMRQQLFHIEHMQYWHREFLKHFPGAIVKMGFNDEVDK